MKQYTFLVKYTPVPEPSFLTFIGVFFYTNIHTEVHSVNTFATSARHNKVLPQTQNKRNAVSEPPERSLYIVSVTQPADPRAAWKIQLPLCTRGAAAPKKSVAPGVSALHIIFWCENVCRRRGNEHQQMSVHVVSKACGRKDGAPGNRGRELRPLDPNVKKERIENIVHVLTLIHTWRHYTATVNTAQVLVQSMYTWRTPPLKRYNGTSCFSPSSHLSTWSRCATFTISVKEFLFPMCNSRMGLENATRGAING